MRSDVHVFPPSVFCHVPEQSIVPVTTWYLQLISGVQGTTRRVSTYQNMLVLRTIVLKRRCLTSVPLWILSLPQLDHPGHFLPLPTLAQTCFPDPIVTALSPRVNQLFRIPEWNFWKLTNRHNFEVVILYIAPRLFVPCIKGWSLRSIIVNKSRQIYHIRLLQYICASNMCRRRLWVLSLVLAPYEAWIFEGSAISTRNAIMPFLRCACYWRHISRGINTHFIHSSMRKK
jgi:hypothetical protein